MALWVYVRTVYIYIPSLMPIRIALTRGKKRLGTEIGARTTHGMWNCAEIIVIAK